MTYFSIWQILLIVGATFRLTRLIVDDTLLRPFREWVEHKEVPPGGYVPAVSFTTLINCSWCAGLWISAGVVGLSAAWGGFFWLWGALSLSMAVGWEALLREKLEVD